MTGDAQTEANERERADERERNEPNQDEPNQSDSERGDTGPDDPERDDHHDRDEVKRDDPHDRDEVKRDDPARDDSEKELTETRTPMSEATTDAERLDESSTDLAIRRNLFRAALALFALLAVVAVLQLYGSVNATINTFVASEYRPPFRAAFNLVVLLASGIGISWCVRELTGE